MERWTRAVGALALLVLAPLARAAECGCEQLRCIEGLIEQKTALAAGYDALATKWGRFIKVEGQPADIVNFNEVTDPARRAQFYRDMLKLHEVFNREEDAMAGKVGPPTGCDFTPGLAAETDNYATCKVNDAALRNAQAQAPCRQIGELLARHEHMHRDRCLARQQDRAGRWTYSVEGAGGQTASRSFPALMLTPAGRAREEAAAYRMEIAALKQLAAKIEPKCAIAFTGATIACKMPGVTMGQDISGKVCGDPTTGTWTINTVSWARPGGRNVDPPWESDCVAKGSAEEARQAAIYRNANSSRGGGWMCVYEDGPQPTVIIRSFYPPPCSPSGEQAPVRVRAVRTECDAPWPPKRPAPPPPREPRPPVS
ncbi:MAG TPA: hypothetical protein VEY50_12155 [Lysobacter sp.]|nr:hypothetical protein [Lysobacter sp.]